jgi:hypothetical protein
LPSARKNASNPSVPQPALLGDVVANPTKFDKQLVTVEGFVTIRPPETLGVCIARASPKCLFLDLPSDYSNFGEFDGRRCRIVGRVNADEHGMCCYAGALNVVRMDEVASQ